MVVAVILETEPISIWVSVLVIVGAFWIMITRAFFILTVVEAEKIPYSVCPTGIEAQKSALRTSPVAATLTEASSVVVPILLKVRVLAAWAVETLASK